MPGIRTRGFIHVGRPSIGIHGIRGPVNIRGPLKRRRILPMHLGGGLGGGFGGGLGGGASGGFLFGSKQKKQTSSGSRGRQPHYGLRFFGPGGPRKKPVNATGFRRLWK